MNIAGLGERIVIQKHCVIIDQIGNHINEWTNFYHCWSGIKNSGRGATETQEAAQTSQKQRLDFTVRACPELADITSTEYRIHYNGRIYNIENIDNTDKAAVKITAALENR